MTTKIQRWLSQSNGIVLTLWASVAAFSCYFSMYAFRKPFTAATYEGLSFWDIDYKIILVVSQVLGYMLSKFIGIKVISEMTAKSRPLSILCLIGFAELALLGFALVPTPYNIVCLFFNGLPLGLIWGIVFSFLEGRRQTEAMGAGLAVSFIISSGVSKSIGKTLMLDYHVSAFWMPFATGALFIVPLLISVWMLSQIPTPSVLDEKMRSKRQPMNGKERSILFKRYIWGLVPLTFFYFMLTAFRDFRDNFIVEIWADLGYNNATILTTAEIPIAVCVLIIVGLTVFIKDNATAFWVNHLAILVGCCVVMLATYCYENHWISPIYWMIAVGFGLYLAYILFQSLIFDRLLATFKEIGNAGFLMYVADAFGYLGSVGILFLKNFGAKKMAWSAFFIQASFIVSFMGIVLVFMSLSYFYQKYESRKISFHTDDMILDFDKKDLKTTV
jgi:Family of unknown function (DUF5690)